MLSSNINTGDIFDNKSFKLENFVHIGSCYRIRKGTLILKEKKIHYMVRYINSGMKNKLF